MSHDLFFEEVRIALKLALNRYPSLNSTDTDNLVKQISAPPQFEMGQAAVPCHGLSKLLRKSPIGIAEDLKTEILTTITKDSLVSEVKAVNGYLNFFCNFSNLAPHLFSLITSGKFFEGVEVSCPEKILIEYSQPNTHKALHVGHLRNVVYGDAVCNLLEYGGNKIVRATFPGDMGNHIAKVLWYIERFESDKIKTGNADWLGDAYARSHDKLTSVKGSDEEETVKKEIGLVLNDLQNRSGKFYDLYLETRKWSLDQLDRIYAWLGTSFEIWFFESECDGPSRELVLQKFKEGFFAKSEGAIGIDLSEYGLGFAMFLKTDGNGLYLTKDLELIRRKFLDKSLDRSIVVVDSRQKLHFRQLFKTAELMGYPQAAKSVHLSYESVFTEDGKPFSSRSQNGIPLETLKNKIEEKIKNDFLNQYAGDWSQEEINETARQIGLGALKYGMLKVDSSNTIRFVLDEWLRLDGDTGPYLQYVHARCASLIKKQIKEGSASGNLKNFEFKHPVEAELLMFMSHFNKAALQAAEEYRPSIMAAYLYDLSKLFNYFYKECPVKDTEGALRESRLALVNATRVLLAKGLSLLGIPTPERM